MLIAMYLSYKLKNAFVDNYKNIKPPFGFNGLGELVYMRTYSRLKEEGTNEQWFETTRRVVEGCYTIQKNHITANGLGWDEETAHKSAEEMYDRIFNMKFLPPGRSLWAMGTSIIHEKGLYAALCNCAFYSTKDIGTNPTRPFEFLMDMSMLGVGVGFDTEGKGLIKITEPIGDIQIQIADTREGWVNSLKVLLEAFFKAGPIPTFDYSIIRPEGVLIKTFGGKASGPEPLRILHERIKTLFKDRKDTFITVTDIVDIMNMIGCCVIAGNVRRTAEISFGNPTDPEYLKLKDYKWNGTEYVGSNAKRASWGWSSNNSVFAKLGMDYTELAKQTASNGEPGYAWLDNMKAFSRMGDARDYKDIRATGTNPCGEQTLESGEMCCLVETFPTRCFNKEDFLRTLKFAYLYGKTVTLGNTHWVETNRVMLRNRRIGTSISGIAQFLDTNGISTLKTWLTEGYATIQRYDRIYSDWLVIPKSIKTTSIKPSGTVSLLPGVTPGIHFPEANYFIRRVRISKNSSMVKNIKKAGYKVEPDVADTSTFVVEIPVEIKNVRPLTKISMWEQLSLAAFIQEHWADNQVSCTVTFNDTEKEQISSALNYFQYKLKGISFLPKVAKGIYAQMPYEEISETVYNDSIKNIKQINFTNIGEESKPEVYCDGDSCTVL
jgi:ribonucleoside-triphosphate reductase (thioredoxin)